MNEFIAKVRAVLDKPVDETRFLLAGNARWKQSVFVYEPFKAQPSFVVKVPSNDASQQQCDTEYRGLGIVAACAIPNTLAPTPLGAFEHGGYTCYVQNVVVSDQWLGKMPLFRRRPPARLFKRATEHLIAVYEATRRSDNEPGKSFARCYQHGDYWVGNLGSRQGAVVLYDFEFATADGLPLFDLLQFALYYRVALRNMGKVGGEIARNRYDRKKDARDFAPSVDDVEVVFVRPGPFSALMRRCLLRYLEGCGIRREDGVDLCREYVEVDRGISGMARGWESVLLA